MEEIVLASASPRRRRLMEEAGYRFRVAASAADETPPPGAPPEVAAVALAQRKARAVEGLLVLAADTIVALGSEIIGKPADAADARRILARLSGRAHRVVTGVAVRRGGQAWSGFAETSVRFRRLDAKEIEAYVETGEPMDKAGAYAIQGGALAFVEEVDGPRDNVVGLPMDLVARLLAEAGYSP